jgi:sugar lactone lactonase YvrE
MRVLNTPLTPLFRGESPPLKKGDKGGFNNFTHYIYMSSLVILTLFIGLAKPVFPLGLEKVEAIIPSGMDTGLLGPSALCYDDLRNLLIVTNTEAQRVAIMNRQGIATKVLGKGGTLLFPTAVAVTKKGNLIIAERGKESLKVIQQYESVALEEYRTLDLSTYRRNSAVQTSALFVDTSGNLYIADRGNRQIIVLDGSEKLKFQITDVGEPSDVWTGSGKIFVSDPGFGGIRVYSDAGRILPTMGTSPGKFREPLRIRTLAVDRRGRIWAVEEGNGIKVIDSFDNLLHTIKPEASGLLSPVDMTIDENNNLYVLEQGGNRITVFRITE